jgi:isopentenyl diphosphate isomerase/L-lactate dehydrogenase-like FMN-dependent dehydrogenase
VSPERGAALLNVFEYEEAARKALPPAHFGYLATGVEDDATLAANRAAFQRVQLRARRLVDVSRTDLSVELFGGRFDTPIGLCPVASQRAFHPQGELASARAASSRNALQLLSTAATASVEEVNQARGREVWFQLYPTSRWDYTERLVMRAEGAGCRVLVLTVDVPGGRNTETEERFKRADKRLCGSCHDGAATSYFRRKPMFAGLDMAGVTLTNAAVDWAFVGRLKKLSRMKLVLKGIVTAEDARLAREVGADGVIVSNHGGRAEESGRGSLESLPEVVDAVGAGFPVLLDGGVRRGSDVFKALALGAHAVCIGRPYIWGLAAFGQAGVEQVLDILRNELRIVMQQCGVRSVGEIGRSNVVLKSSG